MMSIGTQGKAEREHALGDVFVGEVPQLPHHRVDQRFELVVAELPAGSGVPCRPRDRDRNRA